MFENDYWMRQIEDMTKALGNMLFEKQSGTVEMFSEQGVLSETSFLTYRLNRMIGDGKINEAEDLLFDTIKENKGPGYLRVAVDFYATLQKRTDEELAEANFSRQEILEGLQAVQKLFKN